MAWAAPALCFGGARSQVGRWPVCVCSYAGSSAAASVGSASLQRPFCSHLSYLLESPARSKGSPLGFDSPRTSNDRQPGGGRASRKVSVPFSVDPAASRCPVHPASGRSRFGVAALRRIVRFPPAARPCGFSLSANSDPRPPSFAIARLNGSFLRQRRLPQVMHRRLTFSL